MKAVRYHSYGDSGVLVYEEAERPTAGPGQVVVQGGRGRVQPAGRRDPRRALCNGSSR